MSYKLDEVAYGSGFKVQGVGAETLTAYKLVHLDSGGEWEYANASTESTMPAIGITVGGISAGQRGTILLMGLVKNNSWNFTPGQLLYTSTTVGEITTTPPQGTGNQVQVIGKALSQTLIMFNPSYVLVEVS